MTILKELVVYSTDGARGAVIDGLQNDVVYDIKIIASNEALVSPPSNMLEVMPHPTPNPVPSACVLIGASAASTTQINVEFDEPTVGTKPFDFIGIAVSSDDTTEQDVDPVAVQGSYFGALKGLKPNTVYSIQVYARNASGNGEPSNTKWVTTPASITQPKIESATGKTWSDGDYNYIYWNDAGAFTAQVHPSTMIVDLIIVGGGGGGYGQVAPFATGGNGGGGDVYTSLGMTLAGGLLIGAVGAGGEHGNGLPAGKSEFSYYSANGGGNAIAKADGTPSTPTTVVPDEFKNCSAFMWNAPLSYNVSGFMPWSKNAQPNGVVYGQGGGGTNGTVGDSRAGEGQSGVVCIRWKK